MNPVFSKAFFSRHTYALMSIRDARIPFHHVLSFTQYQYFTCFSHNLTIVRMVIYKLGDVICESGPDVYATDPAFKDQVCDRCFVEQ